MKHFLLCSNKSFPNEKTKQFINNNIFATVSVVKDKKEGWGRRDLGKGLCSLFR